MNWHRGYKLTLLSQLPLFRMITSFQIHLGSVFIIIKSQDCFVKKKKINKKYWTATAGNSSPDKSRAVPQMASNPTPLLHPAWLQLTASHSTFCD